jgi:choline dehydrogenase-like flavoprotein
MAARPDDGPCDERGAVFGVRGLYVVDAASLPSNTGVNPQITIMANALRIAAGVIAEARTAV